MDIVFAKIQAKKIVLTVKPTLFFCTPLGIRTLDPLIKSQLLYQLS